MTMAWRTLVFALLLVLLAIGPASAHEGLTGIASVIDGDTIEIHGQRICLHGIDAPESSQLCVRPIGECWHCGQQAADSKITSMSWFLPWICYVSPAGDESGG